MSAMNEEFAEQMMRLVAETASSMSIARSTQTSDLEDICQELLRQMVEGNVRIPPDVRSPQAWMRTTLHRRIIDHKRRKGRLPEGSGETQVELAPSDEVEQYHVEQEEELLYSLFIWNMALQSMRDHCRGKGQEIWDVFEIWFRSQWIHGRDADEAIDDVRSVLPGLDRQSVQNRLTSAKRILRNIIAELIPPSARLDESARDRVVEWKRSFTAAGAIETKRLRVALCLNSVPALDASISRSVSMISRPELFSEPSEVPRDWNDNELRILLQMRLKTPLWNYVRPDAEVPPRPGDLAGSGADAQEGQDDSESLPPTLLDFLGESHASSSRGKRVELLRSIKKSAKWSKHQDDYAIPVPITKLTYTLAIALALVDHGERISSVDDEQMRLNFRWALKRPWLDERLRPKLQVALRIAQSSLAK